MPSFPTSNDNYKHFFSITRHYPDDIVGSQIVVFCKFIFYSMAIMIYSILLIVWRLLIDYGYYHNHHFHDSDLMQFIYNWCYMLFLTIFNISIIILLTSGITRSQICYQLIIGSTIYNKCCQYILFTIFILLIFTTIAMIPYLIFYCIAYNIGFNELSTSCKILQCDHITIIYIINHFIIPCIAPSIGIITWYIISLCLCPYQLEISYNSSEETVTIPPQQQINHIVDFAKIFRDTITGSTKYSISKTNTRQSRNGTIKISPFPQLPQPSPLLNNDYHILAEEYDIDHFNKFDLNARPSKITDIELSDQSNSTKQDINRYKSNNPSLSKAPPEKIKGQGSMAMCYALLFTSCYAFFMVLMNVYMDMKHDLFNQNIQIIFVSMRCIVSIFQFLLTRIGRKCDELIHEKDKYNCFISIEYLMEWYCTITYYILFRYLIAYHTPHIAVYLILLALHILFEIPLSFKLLFNAYYDITNDWINIKIKTRSKYWYRLFYDNSTKEEWRNRCCMDIILRFYASILSTLMQTLILISVNEKDVHIVYLYDQHYHAVLKYIFISNLYEFIHLIAIYIYSKQNVLNPFVNYISSMTFAHQFIHLTVFATVLVILLS